jgi:hypothetical protein
MVVIDDYDDLMRISLQDPLKSAGPLAQSFASAEKFLSRAFSRTLLA